MNEIAERIKTARLAAGITQKQLAEAVGYKADRTGVRYIQRWEYGDRPIPV